MSQTLGQGIDQQCWKFSYLNEREWNFITYSHFTQKSIIGGLKTKKKG
jgi:hypothetical protein